MNGYTKRNSKSLIPLSLNELFAIYFFIHKKENLFRIKFKCNDIKSISSKSAHINLSNDCYKIIVRIGNDLNIEIPVTESLINVDGIVWKKDAASKFIDIVITMNRKAICSCTDTNGNVEFVFKNIKQQKRNIVCFMQHCCLTKIYQIIPTGYYKIKLKQDFDYDSCEQVSIESHGTDEINVLSNGINAGVLAKEPSPDLEQQHEIEIEQHRVLEGRWEFESDWEFE